MVCQQQWEVVDGKPRSCCVSLSDEIWFMSVWFDSSVCSETQIRSSVYHCLHENLIRDAYTFNNSVFIQIMVNLDRVRPHVSCNHKTNLRNSLLPWNSTASLCNPPGSLHYKSNYCTNLALYRLYFRLCCWKYKLLLYLLLLKWFSLFVYTLKNTIIYINSRKMWCKGAKKPSEALDQGTRKAW